MTNIVGLVSQEGWDRIEYSIDVMRKKLCRQPASSNEIRILPPFAMAAISLEDKRTITEKDSILLAFSGELVDEEKLRQNLLQHGDKDAYKYRTSELLLKLYLSGGVDKLCNFNGLYLIIIWEEQQKKLTMINDRLGLQRLYYWQHGSQLIFSSEVKAISSHPEFHSSIDQTNLFDFCSSSHSYDDRTFFKNIRCFPASSILTFQGGRLSIQPYWDFRFWDPNEKIRDESDYIDELAFHTREAVRRRIRKNMAILVTGGLDSRAVAGMVRQCASEQDVITATIGRKNCDDVVFGAEIARSLGYPHTHLPVDSTYLANYAQECTWITEGNLNVHGSWIFAARNFIRENHIRYIMTGLIGNVLSGRHWSPAMMEEKDERKGIDVILRARQSNYPLLARVFRPEVFANAASESLYSIQHSLEKANTHHPMNKFDYMHTHQWVSRIAVTSDIFKDDCTSVDPFADTDLLDFTFRLPPELRAHGYLYKKMIIKHIPEVSELGYDRSHRPLDETVYKENNQLLKIYNRNLRRIRRKLGLAPQRSTGDSPHGCIQYNDWLRSGSREFVLDLLADGDLLGDVFDMTGVNRLVNEHMEGKRNEFKLIGAILTFAIWRRQFCKGVS